jgi:ABC-type uncharacterized transport system substrate-binding protein
MRPVFSALLAACLLLPAVGRAAGRVLIVQSSHAGDPWADGVSRGIRKALAGTGAAVDAFYMDTQRMPDPEWRLKAGEMAMNRCEATRPDVVVAVDDDAQEFFAKRLAGRERPKLVYCGVSADPARYGYPAVNAAGVLERPYFVQTLKLLASIDPGIRRVAVVGDLDEETGLAFSYLKAQPLPPGMSLAEPYRAETAADFRKFVERRQKDSDAVVVVSLRKLRGGSDPRALMAWAVSNSRIPIAGLTGSIIEDGALAGVVDSDLLHGMQAGGLAKAFLAGREASGLSADTSGNGIAVLNLRTAEIMGLRVPDSVVRSAGRLVTGLRIEPESTLSAMLAIIDERIAGLQRSLKALGASSQVRSGGWEAMKGMLSDFQADELDGVLWYALPDGTFYTPASGLERNRIPEQPYFTRLMSGEPVAGELVLSRTTGRAAVVVAVPVLREGKVAAALGVSLFADAWVDSIERSVVLPGDAFFFALDAEGRAVLHRDKRAVGHYPARLGSESLARAVEDILGREEGSVRYEFNGMRKTVMFKTSPLTRWRLALGFNEPLPQGGARIKDLVVETLKRSRSDLAGALADLDAGLAVAARGLSKAGIEGPEARRILSELCCSHPALLGCAAVGPDGKMKTVAPEEYRRFEGADVADQDQVVKVRETRRPVMSPVFRSASGFDVVDLAVPVLSESGEFMGSVSAMFRPEVLIADIVAPVAEGLPLSAWVMQPDGRILYARAEREIGRRLFEDSVYQPLIQLQSLGGRIASEESGTGNYEMTLPGSKSPLRKQAYWERAGLYGMRWSIVVSAPAGE